MMFWLGDIFQSALSRARNWFRNGAGKSAIFKSEKTFAQAHNTHTKLHIFFLRFGAVLKLRQLRTTRTSREDRNRRLSTLPRDLFVSDDISERSLRFRFVDLRFCKATNVGSTVWETSVALLRGCKTALRVVRSYRD